MVVGEHDVSDASDGSRYIPEKWISHPQYNGNTLVNDFAIIILNSEITWSDSAMPICLPSLSSEVHRRKLNTKYFYVDRYIESSNTYCFI